MRPSIGIPTAVEGRAGGGRAVGQLKRSGIVSLAVGLLMLLSWPGTAQARTPGVTVVGPADSIQAAVDAATPGDTILVFGTHRENVAIVKDGLTLRGVGARILPPLTPATHACFDPAQPGEAIHGICVSGDVDLDTGEVPATSRTSRSPAHHPQLHRLRNQRHRGSRRNHRRQRGGEQLRVRDLRNRRARCAAAVQPRLRHRQGRLLRVPIADGGVDRQRRRGQPLRHPDRRQR